MSDNQTRESYESKRQRKAEQDNASEREPAATTDPTPAYAPSLLGDPGISRRGNTSIRAANLQGMQRTLGNRAVQRYVQRSVSVQRDFFDDWKFKPTLKGSTDSRYDNPENKRRAEMKDADQRSNDPSPPNWWEKPKYDPSAPLPWMPKTTTPSGTVSPGGTVAPPQSPDQSNGTGGPGDYPENTLPDDEEYA